MQKYNILNRQENNAAGKSRGMIERQKEWTHAQSQLFYHVLMKTKLRQPSPDGEKTNREGGGV